MSGKRALRLPSGARLSCSFEVPDAAEWRALTRQASATSTFRVPGWIETWANSYLPKGRWRGPYRPLSVRNERGELVAVFPLARMKFGPIEFRAAVGPYCPSRSCPDQSSRCRGRCVCGSCQLVDRLCPVAAGLADGSHFRPEYRHCDLCRSAAASRLVCRDAQAGELHGYRSAGRYGRV